MKQFTDNANRVWCVTINVTQIKYVRDCYKLDLFRLLDDGLKPLSELLMDPVRLVDVIYLLCRDQAAAFKVTDEEFGRSMAGDAIQGAVEAFTEELFDFFPDPTTRLSLRKTKQAQKQLSQLLLEEADQKLVNLDLAAEVRKILGGEASEPSDSFTTVPGERVSIPGRTP